MHVAEPKLPPFARAWPWVGLLVALAGSPAARAGDVLFIYGGYADDNAYERTLEQAYEDHRNDRVVDTLDAYDVERAFEELLVVEGEAEVVRFCDGGPPPDLKMLEDELERLKRNLDFEGQIFAYTIAIDELVCAGENLSQQEAASLYVQRGMVHHKNGAVDQARDDFRRAFVLSPEHAWDKRHTPKARADFDEIREQAADEYSYSIYVADDGPYGSGITIDGIKASVGAPIRLTPGEHLISWRAGDHVNSGIIEVWSTATMIGPMGLFDFLFRIPKDQAEERLRDAMLVEMAWYDEVDEVVPLEPLFVRGSLAKMGRFSSPARAGFGGGYSRYSYFNYGSVNAELWLRIWNVIHADLRAQFDITSGRPTGGEVITDPEAEEATTGPAQSDYYMMPTVQIGVIGQWTQGKVQPGGGLGFRLQFTGPSLIVQPAMVFRGGVDLRPGKAPIVIRFNILGGFILTAGENDSAGRSLEWADGGRGIFNFSFGLGFVL